LRQGFDKLSHRVDDGAEILGESKNLTDFHSAMQGPAAKAPSSNFLQIFPKILGLLLQ
jgi:hypothetical protein